MDHVHVRTRQPIPRVKAQRGILNQHGAVHLLPHQLTTTSHPGPASGTYRVGGLAALGLGDLLDGALDLLDVDGLAVNADGRLEDGLDLAQLVGVARDEVDDAGAGHGGRY